MRADLRCLLERARRSALRRPHLAVRILRRTRRRRQRWPPRAPADRLRRHRLRPLRTRTPARLAAQRRTVAARKSRPAGCATRTWRAAADATRRCLIFPAVAEKPQRTQRGCRYQLCGRARTPAALPPSFGEDTRKETLMTS